MAKEKNRIIGRQNEMAALKKAVSLRRNVLIEGPVGVGKTFLVREVLNSLHLECERVDGDTRYTENKLTGWFDPPLVLKKGYVASAFIEGPLVRAMKEGKILFINELNRMPESVQNILLPAMDERQIMIPKLGAVNAKPGFVVLATQNPREFTATHSLSEALLDRFEMIPLGYQSKEEELEILLSESRGKIKKEMVLRILEIVRATRSHPSIKRGASIRSALSILHLVEGGMELEQSCLMALPSRIEMISSDDDPFEVIRDLISKSSFPELKEKKSPLKPLKN